jgi:DNA sulfur modification protein DndC
MVETGSLVQVEECRTFGRAEIDRIHAEIQQVYKSDQKPWVIGYSGGKDSTTALQLVWSALSALPADQLKKPIYVISSDTLVETPKIIEYIDESLERMNRAAKAQGIPLSAEKVKPEINHTFWVNLIGRGYPVPSTQFRWCTERLKINPANSFILDKVAKHGEVVVVLGVRKSESATRAQVMSLHRIAGTSLSRHSTLPNAYVYTPIEDFSVNDVWTYLLQAPSPWGNNNRDLVTLYRNAQAGECPLVVDKQTSSCGNSRFGCWVCTVVNQDSSMEALVDNGEVWLEPFLEFRNYLATLQNQALWPQIRKRKRRNGRVIVKDGVAQPWGPYTIAMRRHLLRKLLEVQRAIGAAGTNENGTLINKRELELIRNIWRTEENDWADSVPEIYAEVMGTNLDWVRYESPTFCAADLELLESVSVHHGLPAAMVAKLLECERKLNSYMKRSAIQRQLASIIEEDWSSEHIDNPMSKVSE